MIFNINQKQYCMEKHDLHHELPEFNELIHELKTSDKHFRKLFDNYHIINKEIHRLESSGVFTDSELIILRQRRLNLKDELYLILENA
jgi:uncharacterized protein YdcH (DUF465 family)